MTCDSRILKHDTNWRQDNRLSMLVLFMSDVPGLQNWCELYGIFRRMLSTLIIPFKFNRGNISFLERVKTRRKEKIHL